MAKRSDNTQAAQEKDREKWMARFQIRLVKQPGVDRQVVLQAVEEVTAHCDEIGTDPRTAFGDPDTFAEQVAERLVPADRAERERRRYAAVDSLSSFLKRIGSLSGP